MQSFEVKTELLLRQTRLRVPSFGAKGEIAISPIEKGGSDRRFYRIRCTPEQSLILVKYDLAREENRHYVRLADFLAQHQIAAPQIYFHDAEEGLIWLEDLGERDLYSYRDEPWLVRRAFYEAALQEICKLHDLPEKEWASLRGEMPPEFNAALYRWEQSYFFENCLGRIFGMAEEHWRGLAALPELRAITDELAALPRSLVHRDFQSQNVMLRNGRAYLIDFQGMRPGLPEYDLASLLYDPYVQISAGERDELCRFYLDRRLLGTGSEFRVTLRWCATQRLMQALGAYGFLGLVKGHRQFLAHVPTAMQSLRDVTDELPELSELSGALARFIEKPPAGRHPDRL